MQPANGMQKQKIFGDKNDKAKSSEEGSSSDLRRTESNPFKFATKPVIKVEDVVANTCGNA